MMAVWDIIVVCIFEKGKSLARLNLVEGNAGIRVYDREISLLQNKIRHHSRFRQKK